MKKWIIISLVFAFSVSNLFARDKFTLQLKWVTQAQFMGYFVKQKKRLLQSL